MLQNARVYVKLLRMNILAGVEYKGWWLMVIQTFVVVLADLVSTFLLFSRFGSIGEWTLERIVLIYALAVTAFGLAETLCRGFDYFPWHMIRSGNFDRVLLRPRSLTVQVAGSYFHLHRISRVVTGLFLIIWALSRMGVTLGPWQILMLLCCLCGGFVMYCGVFILTSGIAFFSIKSLDWIFILTNASYQVARCPVPYLPRILYHVFTFFLPMLVISYYPASALCGWGEPLWTGWMALPAGLAFLGISLAVWRFGVRHYKSTGS